MSNDQEVIEERRGIPQSGEGSPPTPPDQPYGYYAGLIALYNLLFGAFLFLYRRNKQPLEQLTPFDIGLLGLATLRLSKLVSEDEVTSVIRRPVIEAAPDGRHPRGRGLRYAIGKLVLCPTCTGTWVAAFLTYALHLSPRYTRPLLAVLSASAVEQTSDALLSLVYTDRDALRERELNNTNE